MLLKKTIQKTKKFFLKTLQNLKNYLFGSYDKIPKLLFLNPLSCSSSINQRSHQLDHIYSQFTNQSPSDHDQNNAGHPMSRAIDIVPSKEDPMANVDAADHHSNGISSSCEAIANDHKKQVVAQRKIEPSSSFSSLSSSRYGIINGSYNVLAQKMKELEMMDLSDVDQSLDVEEALHYYSRLTCPVYVDIVNKFFMDMYAEFVLPQPCISLSTSSRRLRPLTL